MNDKITTPRPFKVRQYQILKNNQWKNISKVKAKELLKTGDYKSIELYDNDTNYKANGLFFCPQEKENKFEDIEKGLNELMNKYNNK